MRIRTAATQGGQPPSWARACPTAAGQCHPHHTSDDPFPQSRPVALPSGPVEVNKVDDPELGPCRQRPLKLPVFVYAFIQKRIYNQRSGQAPGGGTSVLVLNRHKEVTFLRLPVTQRLRGGPCTHSARWLVGGSVSCSAKDRGALFGYRAENASSHGCRVSPVTGSRTRAPGWRLGHGACPGNVQPRVLVFCTGRGCIRPGRPSQGHLQACLCVIVSSRAPKKVGLRAGETGR